MRALGAIREVLVVRLGRLGDIILLLPAIAALKQRIPGCRLTLLTDHRYAPLAQLSPVIDEVIPINRLEMRDGNKLLAIAALMRLLRSIRRRRFDLIVDFHSFTETQLMAGLSRARNRIAIRRFNETYLSFCFNQPPVEEDKAIHVAEMFLRLADAIQLGTPGSSGSIRLLEPTAAARNTMREALPQGSMVGFYVGARARDHLWSAERFASLADQIVREFDSPVVLIGGRSSEEQALTEDILRRLQNRDRVIVLPSPDLAELVAAISSLRLLVSNDSGPMHIGPAVGVPTLGLFSRSSPQHYKPFSPQSRYLWAEPIERISVEAVMSVVREMWLARSSSF